MNNNGLIVFETPLDATSVTFGGSHTQFAVLELKRSLSGALASCGCAQIFSAEPRLGKVAHGSARRTAGGTAREVSRKIARETADGTVDRTARGIFM